MRSNGAMALLLAGLCGATGASPAPAQDLVTRARPCLNLRSGPSTDDTTIRCLPPGREMTLLESRQDWGRVRLPDGEEGWVALRLVDRIGDAPTTSAPGEGEPVGESRPSEERSEEPTAETEALRTESGELRAEVSRLTAELAARADEAKELRARISRQDRESLETAQKVAADRAARDEAAAEDRRRIDEIEAALAAAALERDRTESERSELEGDVAALRTAAEYERRRHAEEVAALEAEIERLAEAQRIAEAQAQAAEATRAAEQDEGRRDLTELETALSAAESERDELRRQVTALEASATGLEAAREEDRARVEDLTARLGAAEVFFAESERRRSETEERLAALLAENRALRNNRRELATPPAGAADPGEAPMAEAAGGAEDPEPAPPASLPEAGDLWSVVQEWAAAWSDQRVDDYLAFYSTAFEPADGSGRDRWETRRRERIAAPARIEVAVAFRQARTESPDRAEIEFLQSYDSDTFADVVVKTLVLARESDAWKIVGERVD